MRRRSFLYGGLGALAACTQPENAPQSAASDEQHRWRMVTSWPPNFPGHGVSAIRLARRLGELTGGRLDIEVFAANELVPALEVLDAVSRGAIQLGHSAPIYWRGQIPAAQLFGSVPFGMTPDAFNAWLFHGGGLELWREAYAGHDIIPFPAGNTGPQMGGWFNREINSLADLKGLKMRIPGLGGEVMRRAGVLTVNLPLAEIFTALQTGAIDATEWVGPYNDMAIGLHQAARYYYYPGWQEPSGALELLVSKPAYETLSAELQYAVETACIAENSYLLAEFNTRNHDALKTLTEEHQVELRRFPDDVLEALQRYSLEILDELAASDPMAARVYASYRSFSAKIDPWLRISLPSNVPSGNAR
ncbi:MAG: TRAP transporter substrate-binding protein [Gammaproteobacteria bacterium]|nr:MAG: TRAP transporter substrate-binding protein [Gammaproteobacteria bacterium]